MYTRTSKVLLTWAVALYSSLVVFNNLTDYRSNFLFVCHVLKMDSITAESQAMWRSIDSTFLHHAFYWLIILVEMVVAVLCWAGGFRLSTSTKDPDRFNQSKGLAIAGLTLGIILWFVGFITIGGEWFLMWQSHDWSGLQAAFRLVVIFGIVLLYLIQIDRPADA